MVVTLLFIFVLLAVTVLFHYESLRLLSALTNTRRGDPRAKMMIIMFVLIGIHLMEIGFYAVAFWFGAVFVKIGTLQNIPHATILDFFYFSTTTYTTVGYGDITANGSLRIISGVEALDGVLLLSWSASFTYLAMQKYWDTQGDNNLKHWLRRVFIRPSAKDREKAEHRAERKAARAAKQVADSNTDDDSVPETPAATSKAKALAAGSPK